MELQIRNYILYKARTFEERKKELQRLKKFYEEMKQDIIDETTSNMDGLPRGKGGKSDPTQSKVLRFEQLSNRIKILEREINIFNKAEEKINAMRFINS